MSEEQQRIAVGRTVEEFMSSRIRLAALQAQARRFSESLFRAASHLRALSELNIPTAGPLALAAVGDLADIPTVDDLISTASQIKVELDRKHTLQAALKNMGMPFE